MYPVLEEKLSSEADKVEEAEHEHQEAHDLIEQIRGVEDLAELVEPVGQLEAEISHHVDEEESEMLPKERNATCQPRLRRTRREARRRQSRSRLNGGHSSSVCAATLCSSPRSDLMSNVDDQPVRTQRARCASCADQGENFNERRRHPGTSVSARSS